MMQKLIGAVRQAGLHIFRHRKAMLFVSPIRLRPFRHDSASVSSSVAAIIGLLTDVSGISHKQLLEKLQQQGANEVAPEDAEKQKLALASDLRWLVSAGHVIEFNDGSLDLVRSKPATPTASALSETPVPNEKAVAIVSLGDAS